MLQYILTALAILAFAGVFICIDRMIRIAFDESV